MTGATIDATHAADRKSWVASANGHSEFPIQNLPFGIFVPGDGRPRGGVAIGDMILDMDAVLDLNLFRGAALAAAEAAADSTLNAFLSLGKGPRTALRLALADLLDSKSPERPELLHAAADCSMELPIAIGDYTDFYAGIHHATNVGKLLRPDNPLLPNYKHVPIGYHGRASSIRPSGMPIHRPSGQRKPANEAEPSFGACRNLDFELELGIWLGPGNPLSEAIPITEAADHIAGFCLLNDWSARDIQSWEYQPLGPFLAKNFATTISPWIVTAEALAPFRIAQSARPEGDPKPMAYLWDEGDQASGALDLELEVLLITEGLRAKDLAPHRLTIGSTRHLYWTVAQFVAHHTVGGCNLQPGDLFGSGTISGTTKESFGSLLEITVGGREPISLSSGETRRFLEDGDEIVFRAHAKRAGYASIGLGECRASVLPAR
ncbi:MAG TPA: fumarylacetoacetase [Magnetospirillaceae bacterium]